MPPAPRPKPVRSWQAREKENQATQHRAGKCTHTHTPLAQHPTSLGQSHALGTARPDQTVWAQRGKGGSEVRHIHPGWHVMHPSHRKLVSFLVSLWSAYTCSSGTRSQSTLRAERYIPPVLHACPYPALFYPCLCFDSAMHSRPVHPIRSCRPFLAMCSGR